jgi:outer membrane protein OmpA-like peptidoglycan-associated protein
VTELTQTVATLEKKLAAAEDAHEKALADAKAAGTASVAQVRSLYSGAAALGGKLTENGILLSLAGDELQFASGTATLPDGDLPSLDRIAAFLKDQPGLTIRIEGHTDSSGSAEINQQLSKQRAEAVMQALIDRGVAADRISATGLGEENPIADNATEAGKRANRRVEIYAVREH